MRYQAINQYSANDTCGHFHRTKEAAEACCNKTYAHNVGRVIEIMSKAEESELRRADLEMLRAETE